MVRTYKPKHPPWYMTERQQELVGGAFPKIENAGRPRQENLKIFQAVLWYLWEQKSWRELPPEIANHHTCRRRLEEWQKEAAINPMRFSLGGTEDTPYSLWEEAWHRFCHGLAKPQPDENAEEEVKLKALKKLRGKSKQNKWGEILSINLEHYTYSNKRGHQDKNKFILNAIRIFDDACESRERDKKYLKAGGNENFEDDIFWPFR